MESTSTNKFIYIFGRTGAGKSGLGNKILNQKIFVEGYSLHSETTKIAWGKMSKNSVEHFVCDVPGFGDNQKLSDAGVLKLAKAELEEHGFHAVLFCLEAQNRADVYVFHELMLVLGILGGADAARHVFIVITQMNKYGQKERESIRKRFHSELPELLENSGLPTFNKNQILFSDWDNFETSFTQPFTARLQTLTKYKDATVRLQEQLREEQRRQRELQEELERPKSHSWGGYTHNPRSGRGIFGRHWECLNPGCVCHNDAWLYQTIMSKPGCSYQCQDCFQWSYDCDTYCD